MESLASVPEGEKAGGNRPGLQVRSLPPISILPARKRRPSDGPFGHFNSFESRKNRSASFVLLNSPLRRVQTASEAMDILF